MCVINCKFLNVLTIKLSDSDSELYYLCIIGLVVDGRINLGDY